MKKLLCLMFLLLNCGTGQFSQLQLTDAVKIPSSDHPAVVQIIVGSSVCTATAISSSLLLTADHCLLNGDSVTIIDSASKRLYGVKSQKFFTYRDLEHVDFESLDFSMRDVAIVYFSGKPFESFLEIDTKTLLKENDRVGLVGYGQSNVFKKSGGGLKRYGENKVFSHDENSILLTTSKQGKVGLFSDHSQNPSKDMQSLIAFGDSGGPMIYEGKVIGVASNSTTGFCSEKGRDQFIGALSNHSPLNNDLFKKLLLKLASYVSSVERLKENNNFCDLSKTLGSISSEGFQICEVEGKKYSCLKTQNDSCLVAENSCLDNYDGEKDTHPFESPVVDCYFGDGKTSCHVYFSVKDERLSVCPL